MKANVLNFAKIIDSTHGTREHYQIPKYQREYTWGKKQWDILLGDLRENDIGYFVGPIIVVKEHDEEAHTCQTIYEVIDGQQRLTTLSLLMLALYQKLIGIKADVTFEDEDDEAYFNNCLVDLRTKLVLKVKSEEDHTPAPKRGWLEKGKNCYLRIQPSTQNENLADYRYSLGQAGLLAPTVCPTRFGNRRIARALSFFMASLPGQRKELLDLVAKINQLQFVFISVGSQADAFTLFETLNNRGIPLSAIDIVKNKMLAELQKKHGVDVDDSFEQWQQIVEHIENSDEQERFLRHFYNANHWDPSIQIRGITRANKSKLISIYETIIERNPQAVIDRLCESASQYGPLLYPDSYEEMDEDEQYALSDLQAINAAPSYQLLLYLHMLPTNYFEEDAFLLEAINLIRKFYVRRNVTDYPGTAALDQFHVNTIAACQRQIESNGKLHYEFLQSQILIPGQYSTLDEFCTALSGNIYSDNSTMARYLLIKLDEEHHTREYKPDLWARNKSDDFIWTIEHILPQSDNLSKEWISDLASGDAVRAAELQSEHVDRLGNLTLSGYNSRLSNSSFAKKRELTGDKKVGDQKIAIGYKNGLAINSMPFQYKGKPMSLAKATTWNAELIEARTQHMVDRLVELFVFGTENRRIRS